LCQITRRLSQICIVVVVACAGVYLALIGEETKWLDELDAKLAKGLLRASADAEELSEELDVSCRVRLRFYEEFAKVYRKMRNQCERE